MGFLSGAYGKLMAGKYLRTLQHQETMVQARLRRCTRQVGEMEKRLTRMEKQVNANMQRQFQAEMCNGMSAVYGAYNPLTPGTALVDGTLSDTQRSEYYKWQSNMQSRLAESQSLWAMQFDMIRESMLTPLKEEEDAIQTELDSLKSQIQLAQAEYDAKKEEEKAGAKNIAPDYTGQG